MMHHALIIEDDVAASSVIEERLSDYGFTSFAHAWSSYDAVRAADTKRPDLIVVCDGDDPERVIGAAHAVSEGYGIPALLVTGHPSRLKGRLPRGCSLGGPFLIRELGLALGSAHSS